MSREIKFRAWDIENEIMMRWVSTEEFEKIQESFPRDEDSEYYEILINSNEANFLFYGAEMEGKTRTLRQYTTGYVLNNPEFHVMQYTGLKANGKEIYEGDILTGDLEFIDGIVKWMDDRGSYMLVDSDGYATDSDSAYDPMEWNKLEIIGNIHENPELLTGTQDE